jgi:hypothetical protein
MNHQQLTRIFESGATDNPADEILLLIRRILPAFNTCALLQLDQDITRLFTGEYPGFLASNTRYHNFTHTRSVVLATSRLLHGLACSGRDISVQTMELALYSAYFHDAGLLRRVADGARSGAFYTRNHEQRSIAILSQYLIDRELPGFLGKECPAVIQCTNLSLDPESIAFPSPEARLAGYVLGSADILAQMADRYYLERLPFLFQEHQEGGLHTFRSALELMQKTSSFYHTTILDRLERSFSNVFEAMHIHFQIRWQMDENLYCTSILRNLDYLQTILQRCDNRLGQLKTYLKRVPVTAP